MSEETTTVETTEVETETTSVETEQETTDIQGDQTQTETETTDSDTTDTSSVETESTATEYSEFALPEGVVLNETAMTEAVTYFKENGLSQEQAQGAVDLHTKLLQEHTQQQTDAFNQQVADWQDQAKNDKEFGGDKFDENIKVAQSAVNKFGTPELKQLLEDYGVGNHPEIIRFMVKVGNLTKEDVPGGPASVVTAKDRVSLLYPNDRNDS